MHYYKYSWCKSSRINKFYNYAQYVPFDTTPRGKQLLAVIYI